MENINNQSSVEDHEVSVIFPPSPSTSFDLAGSFRQQHQHPYLPRRGRHGRDHQLQGPRQAPRLGAKSNINKNNVEDNQTPEEDWERRPQKFPVKDEGDVILRKVRSVLNKISRENFSKLRKRWINLIPNNSVQLMEIVRLIVAKSLDEPMYMQIYSRLLGYAFQNQPVDTASITRTYLIAHIHSLLKRCATDIELAKFDRSVQRENAARHKKVMLHRFIAHLFLEDVCSSKFVTEKITDLIGQGRRYPQDADEPLECLCVLLTFSGAKLEKLKGPWLERILQKVNLQEAACSPCVSKRIQFMVLDLLEMKVNGWTPHGKWWTPSVHLDADDEGSSTPDELDAGDIENPTGGVLLATSPPAPTAQFTQHHRVAVPENDTVLEWRVRNPSSSSRKVKMGSNPILGLLNKVVPANMEEIANDMKAVLPKAIDGLNESMDLILAHVISEPYYTQLYAVLLAKVNEKIPYFGKLFSEKLGLLIKKKPEIIGLSCFIGEWYNLDMVSVAEVMKIVDELVRVPWIESLCAFLLRSGRKLNSDNYGKLWMESVLTKLQRDASCMTGKHFCFVMDIMDLHNNNWETIRSLNWISQFQCTDEVPAEELRDIVELLDRNEKAGLQAMRVAFGNKKGNVDRFIFRSILWAIQKVDIPTMKVTGRCIRKLLSIRGHFVGEKFQRIIQRFDLLRAVSEVTSKHPEAWNNFGIIMGELYSTR